MFTVPVKESKKMNENHALQISDIPPDMPITRSSMLIEEIPLQTLNLNNSLQNQENSYKRRKIYSIFLKYDRNGSGYLNISELKEMIKNGTCSDMNHSLAKCILKMNDSNGDEQLDFEEFYELSQQKKWKLNAFLKKYLPLIIPPPHRVVAVGDQVDGAYEDEMKFWPPPLGMITISLIEIILFFYDIIYFNINNDVTNNNGENINGPAATLLIYNPYRRKEMWRFVSYMLIHIGKGHIITNLIVQIILGVLLEVFHHWWRVILIYLAGVVAGSIGTSLINPSTFLAGASGGVYALITAHIATIILNFKNMGKYAIIQLIVLTLYCIADLSTSISNHLNGNNDQIGYIAHLSGALAGLFVGLGVLRNLEIHRCGKILCFLGILTYATFIITAIAIHVFYGRFFPSQDV